MRNALRSWRSPSVATKLPDDHLLEANRNLRELLEDSSIPSSVRAELAPEFEEIERLADRLERDEVHLALFGRVGTGKSSLGNALLGREVFGTSVLHGRTRERQAGAWTEFEAGRVVLLDTPGIDELGGEAREELALTVTRRADIVIMVCEADLTEVEFRALETLVGGRRPVLLVLNKTDRYTETERDALLERLRERTSGLLPPDRVLSAAAVPRPETVIRVDIEGREEETQRRRAPDVHELRERLWRVLQTEGKTLAALNAALFAADLDRQVAARVVDARREIADRLIRRYCIAKGLAVAANPVPVADLLAAAGIDVTMVVHLGRIYGHSPSRREASGLLLTIAAQLAVLMGAYWGVNLVSSTLKGVSAGATTVATGAAQGALAWYATEVTGRAAETWYARGKSWGELGPRHTVRAIVDGLDRDSIMLTARQEILALLRGPDR